MPIGVFASIFVSSGWPDNAFVMKMKDICQSDGSMVRSLPAQFEHAADGPITQCQPDVTSRPGFRWPMG
jgi:hypothetical protein